MVDQDEIAELHRLSGGAMVGSFGGAPGCEIRLAGSSALVLSGVNVADLNMLMIGAATADAEAFLVDAMARADARGHDLLALMAPGASEVLAVAAERAGLVQAGTVPLMVLRGGADVRLGKPCRIELATNPAAARIAGDLVSAAFDLPREAVAQVLEPAAHPSSGADIYLAYDGETPKSSVTVTRSGDTAGIWTMATPPEHQGQGMGRALLTRVIARLSQDGVRRFYLFATAAGFPLYASLGFETLADEAAWVKGHSTQAH